MCVQLFIGKRLNIGHIVLFDHTLFKDKNYNVDLFPCSARGLLNRKLFENKKNKKFRVI